MLNSYEAIYDHGRIQWLDQIPDLEKARIIVTVLPSAVPAVKPVLRRPSPKIAGKGMIVGDIMSPAVPAEDWDACR